MNKKTAIRDAYKLENLENGEALRAMTEEIFSCSPHECEKVGSGFYADVYRISISKPPYNFIVKCHKYPERARAESQQLRLLREHAIVKVPQVYSEKSETLPCDAIVMEYIPGINASQVKFPDTRRREAFANEVVDNLRVWHGVSNRKGFGEIDGSLSKSWKTTYGQKVRKWREWLQAHGRDLEISRDVWRMIDKSYEMFNDIFAQCNLQSSLTHSDYNAWNMMVDPKTFKLTGIIDPIDAGWADLEIDLFHLPNCRPDIGLLEVYLKHLNVDDDFWMRYYFYRFWDDIKHYIRMGWYDEKRFSAYAKQLEDNIVKCR